MTLTNRILIAIGVIVLDSLVFFIPVTAFFMAYILIYNPYWFRDFLNRTNGKEPGV